MEGLGAMVSQEAKIAVLTSAIPVTLVANTAVHTSPTGMPFLTHRRQRSYF